MTQRGKMTVSSQLNDLQTLDQELHANATRRAEIESQLGDDRAVAVVRKRLGDLKLQLDTESKDLQAAEWAADDLGTKRAKVEETLYSGRVRNPKELSGYQQESMELKGRHGKAEDTALEAMGRVETTTAVVEKTAVELAALEADWQTNQAEISTELEQLKLAFASLTKQRAKAAAAIPTEAVTTYEVVRQQKSPAVARVEQGICRGCRISLSTTELQQAKGGGLVRCSSCGRIIFLA